MRQIFLLFFIILFLASCSAAERLAKVGNEPTLETIKDPQQHPNYRKLSMPVPTIKYTQPERDGSLWRQGAKAFFKDQRASQVGDILTVLVNINENAELSNSTERSRENEEKAAIPNFLGLEQSVLAKILPKDFKPEQAINFDSDTTSKGDGKISRSEKAKFNVAATIVQQLPNGNFVIQGKQQFRINFELRELVITGVIRPHDITAQNTIEFEKIAEARIGYGGEGLIHEAQQPRYGQQVYDAIFPY